MTPSVLFALQGKKLWTVKMPATIMTLEAVDYKPKGFKAVAVALANRQVQLYKEKFLVDVIHTEDVVTGLRFGRFAREEGTMVMTTKCKGLAHHGCSFFNSEFCGCLLLSITRKLCSTVKVVNRSRGGFILNPGCFLWLYKPITVQYNTVILY